MSANIHVLNSGSFLCADGLNQDEATQITAYGKEMSFSSGKKIYQFGDKARYFFMVQSGTLKALSYAQNGKEVSFFRLDAGDQFGVEAAFSGETYITDVEAVNDVVLLAFPVGKLDDMLVRFPKFGRLLMERQLKKYRALTERVFEFSTMSVAERVRREIYRLAIYEMQQMDVCSLDTVKIRPAPSHYEIAAKTSTHREAVSREMSSLATRGLIETGRRTIQVNNMSDFSKMLRQA